MDISLVKLGHTFATVPLLIGGTAMGVLRAEDVLPPGPLGYHLLVVATRRSERDPT